MPCQANGLISDDALAIEDMVFGSGFETDKDR